MAAICWPRRRRGDGTRGPTRPVPARLRQSGLCGPGVVLRGGHPRLGHDGSAMPPARSPRSEEWASSPASSLSSCNTSSPIGVRNATSGSEGPSSSLLPATRRTAARSTASAPAATWSGTRVAGGPGTRTEPPGAMVKSEHVDEGYRGPTIIGTESRVKLSRSRAYGPPSAISPATRGTARCSLGERISARSRRPWTDVKPASFTVVETVTPQYRRRKAGF